MAKVILEVEEEGSEATAKKVAKLEKALEKLEKRVKEISGEPLKLKTDPAAKELKKLRSELKRVENAFDRSVRAVRDAEIALESAKRGIGDTAAATRRLAKANVNLVNRSKALVRFTKRLPPELRKTATELKRVTEAAEAAAVAFVALSAAGKASAALSALIASVGKLRLVLGGLVAVLGVREIFRFGKALFSIAADTVEVRRSFDSLIPALRGVTGSTELAKESAEFLDAVSRRLKISTGELIKPYTRLTAALRATNSELQLSDDVFEAVIESGAAFGLTAADINLALNAVVQVVGKGVASMEEFRRQLSERIPNAIPALAKGLGVTIPDAIKLVSSGSLEGAKAVEALARGLRELNKEAAELQLDRLGKNLDNLDRIAEQARVAFADGFAPALNTTVKEIAAMETELVALSSLLGGVVGVVIEQSTKLALGFKDLGDTTEKEVGRALVVVNGLSEAIRVATGLDLGEPFRKYVKDVTGLTASAEKAFRDIEKAAKKAAIGTSESARETEERFRKSFEEITKAAGISAADREAIESELVKEIARVSEESVKIREGLAKLLLKAETASAEERLAVEKFVLETLVKLEETAAEKRAEVFKGFVEAGKVAAAARIEAERKATEESLKLFEQLRAGAEKVALERVEEAAATSSKIEKIELELQQKIEKIREEFVQKRRGLDSEARVKLEKKTAEQITKLRQKAAEDTIKEIERVAKAAEKAAERRIKAEEKIRKEIEKSTATLKKLADQLDDIAKKEDETEGGPLASLADEATTLAEKLEQAASNLEKLFGDPETAKDPGAFLNESFANLETILGGVTAGFGTYGDAIANLGGQTEEFKDFTEQLKDAISKVKAEIENFGPSTQESLGIVLSGFEALVEQGFVSQQAFEQFGPEIKEVLAAAGDAAKVAADKVSALADKSKDLEDLGEAAGKGATGIKKIGEEAEGADTKIVKTKEGLLAIVNVAEKLEEAGKKGAGGVKELGDKAKEAAEPLKKVAEAAEKLQEPILDEDQATNLEALGKAAEKAKEPLGLVAEPVEKIALGAKDLSETLPGIVEQVGKLTPQLEALKKLLTEDPVDLQAIATQLQEISTPLERIGTSLTAVRDAVVALPEPLEKIREPAKELLELVAKAAEDGSFTQIATALGRIAKALPEIPEPIKAFLKALQDLTKLRDEIAQTLKAIADGLAEVGNETILAALGRLEEKLAEIVKDLGAAKTLTEDWMGILDQLGPLLETAGTNASTFADALRSDLVPALKSTKAKGDEARQAIEKLKDETGQSSEAFIKLGEDSHATLTAMVTDAAAAQAAMAALRAEIEATAAAAANLKAPTSGAGT